MVISHLLKKRGIQKMRDWVKTDAGLVVPGYAGKAGKPNRDQSSGKPTMNRADRRRIERIMKKQAKLDRKHQLSSHSPS